MKKKLLLYIAVMGIVSLNTACSDSFLQTSPTDAIGSGEMTDNSKNIESLLNGTYKKMMAYNGAGSTEHDDASYVSWVMRNEVRGLDMMIKRARSRWYAWDYEFDATSRLANDYHSRVIWQYAYNIIKNCNTIIDATENVEAYTSYNGQAKVLRAMMYHQLVRMYQKAYRINPDAPGVPLILAAPSGEYTTESEAKGRGKLSEIYTQMVKDLQDAINELKETRASKGYINQQVAQGMMARVLCDMAYAGADNGYRNTLWDDVLKQAGDACTGFSLMSADDWKKGFNNASNEEWIWGFINDSQGNTGYPGFFSFIDRRSGRTGYQNVRVDKAFIDMFEDTDARKLFEMEAGSKPEDNEFHPMKFEDTTDKTGHIPMMRMAEMILIEAEAYTNKGELNKAQEKLDELRMQRISGYTPEVAATTREEMLERIWKERRKELYGEGFAMTDILRLGFIVNGEKATRSNYHGIWVIKDLKDNDDRYIYQIPQEEVDSNPHIEAKDQNP